MPECDGPACDGSRSSGALSDGEATRHFHVASCSSGQTTGSAEMEQHDVIKSHSSLSLPSLLESHVPSSGSCQEQRVTSDFGPPQGVVATLCGILRLNGAAGRITMSWRSYGATSGACRRLLGQPKQYTIVKESR